MKPPKFYELSVAKRIQALRNSETISQHDYEALLNESHQLSLSEANHMIENVVGVMGFPMGLAMNFPVNQRLYTVPLVVEEPSIVAALNMAAKTINQAGGFSAQSTESLLIGQIQLVGVRDPSAASANVLAHKSELLADANACHPNMQQRGGGAKDIELFEHHGDIGPFLVAHIYVDTCDAMGANLVNTLCEYIAPKLEALTEGKAVLRILSNLSDRALVKARCEIPTSLLSVPGFTGEQVRDGIVIASDFAHVDPYRAATHNKGIMNGIDAVALATGNDWRAIEAGAHAYAAHSGQYRGLSQWTRNALGHLVGEITLPLNVGIVGSQVSSNPTVQLNLRLLNLESARELAELMAAIGLAQNFAALKALGTIGIQQGHMSLHARSVALAAQAPDAHFETIVQQLIDSGEVKLWKARELVAQLDQTA